MSYLRGPASDVYVFGSGKNFECVLNYDLAKFGMLEHHTLIPYGETEEDFVAALQRLIGHLNWLKHQGVRVPDDGMARLYADLSAARDDLGLDD